MQAAVFGDLKIGLWPMILDAVEEMIAINGQESSLIRKCVRTFVFRSLASISVAHEVC